MRTDAYKCNPPAAVFLEKSSLHIRVEDMPGYPIILSHSSSHIGIEISRDNGGYAESVLEMHRLISIITSPSDGAQTTDV